MVTPDATSEGMPRMIIIFLVIITMLACDMYITFKVYLLCTRSYPVFQNGLLLFAETWRG